MRALAFGCEAQGRGKDGGIRRRMRGQQQRRARARAWSRATITRTLAKPNPPPIRTPLEPPPQPLLDFALCPLPSSPLRLAPERGGNAALLSLRDGLLGFHDDDRVPAYDLRSRANPHHPHSKAGGRVELVPGQQTTFPSSAPLSSSFTSFKTTFMK